VGGSLLDGLARRLVADEEGSTTRLERDLARPVLEVRGWGRIACWTAWMAWHAALWQMRRPLQLVWSGTWPVLYSRLEGGGEGNLLDCLDGLARRLVADEEGSTFHLVADEEGSTTRLDRELARPVLEGKGWIHFFLLVLEFLIVQREEG
jgi:hypothetical protein